MDTIKTVLFLSVVLLVAAMMFGGINYLKDGISYKAVIEPMEAKLSEYIMDIESEGYLS